MKIIKLQWLCILLSVMTILCFCPVTAAETEPEPIIPKVTVTPVVVSQPFTVGGVTVTEEMYNSITGSGITFGEGGYISYDAQTKTLTMNNAVIESYTKALNTFGSSEVISGIRFDHGQIRVLRLLGENTLKIHADDADAQIYAIYGYSALTIEGDGVLTVDTVNPSSYCYGMELSYLTVNSGTLNIRVGDAAVGAAYGMRVTDGIVFNGGKVDVQVGNAPGSSFGIGALRDVVINGGEISVRVGEAKYSESAISIMAHPMDNLVVGLTMNGGTLTAEGGTNNLSLGYLTMGGEDAWYKYAINSKTVFTYAENTPLDETLTDQAEYLQIIAADTPWENAYADLEAEDWYYEDIAYVTEHGLMQGTGDEQFNPAMLTDRSMLVTVLWRIEGSPAVENPDVSFDDVANGAWYYTPVLWAAQNKLVQGTGGTQYNPTGSLTREQIALILQRYASSKGIDTAADSVDLTAYTYSSWAEPGTAWAVSIGLFDGLGIDVSDLTQTASRAEIAAYLHRFCELPALEN